MTDTMMETPRPEQVKQVVETIATCNPPHSPPGTRHERPSPKSNDIKQLSNPPIVVTPQSDVLETKSSELISPVQALPPKQANTHYQPHQQQQQQTTGLGHSRPLTPSRNSNTTTTVPFVRQNTVGSVLLHGVNIVSLVIDGKERLCLAQISNTLLKDYSYNEIHNRRVALGITCVQCTPVQLEILRRAGAMPVSSRRCGMITKREAERLVKSFLEDTRPPRLPENFVFDVRHECGWGCRGSFAPARYNSSRAKCIKCAYCNMYFSPNKFIFHYHRTPEAKYNHPDAANFNSWRRHLKLTDANASEELCYAWEDVKAMFNGGTRKRALSISSSSSSNHTTSLSPSSSRSTTPAPSPVNSQEYGKRPKTESNSMRSPVQPMAPNSSTNHNPQQHYQFPVFPVPNKVMPMKSVPAHPAFSMPFGYEKNMPGPENMKTNPSWPNSLSETFYPPYEMIWAKHLGLTAPESSFAHRPGPVGTQCDVMGSPRVSQMLSPSGSVGSRDERYHGDNCSDFSDRSSMRSNASNHSNTSDRQEGVNIHMSAFRPVLQREPQLQGQDNHVPERVAQEVTQEVSEESLKEGKKSDGEALSDNEDVDVDTIDESVDFKITVCKYEHPIEENNNDPTGRSLDLSDKEKMMVTGRCVEVSSSSSSVGEREREGRPRSCGSVDIKDSSLPTLETGPRRPSSVGDTIGRSNPTMTPPVTLPMTILTSPTPQQIPTSPVVEQVPTTTTTTASISDPVSIPSLPSSPLSLQKFLISLNW